MALGSTTAYADVCAGDSARMALTTRVLQTDLMVAALSCSQKQRYAAFVERFSPELIKNGKALRTFYSQNYGKTATKRINALVTRLANESSRRSIDQGRSNYCAGVDRLFDDVMRLEVGQLALYARFHPTADTHGVPTCASVRLVDDAMQLPQ